MGLLLLQSVRSWGNPFVVPLVQMVPAWGYPFVVPLLQTDRWGGSAAQVFSRVEWPEVAPYKPDDFQRFDESSDAAFYASPRFVTHIDDAAIGALTQ